MNRLSHVDRRVPRTSDEYSGSGPWRRTRPTLPPWPVESLARRVRRAAAGWSRRRLHPERGTERRDQRNENPAAAQTRSASSLIPSHGNHVPATSVKARHPRPASRTSGDSTFPPGAVPPGRRPRGVGQPHRLDVRRAQPTSSREGTGSCSRPQAEEQARARPSAVVRGSATTAPARPARRRTTRGPGFPRRFASDAADRTAAPRCTEHPVGLRAAVDPWSSITAVEVRRYSNGPGAPSLTRLK